MLPAAVLAPFAASLADRFRRERFLLAIALVGAAALAISAVGALADERYTVVAAAAVVGISSTLFRPALQALLPSLASTPQELVAANSTTSVLESAGTVVGPIAAAALVATAGVSAIFATGAATLVLAALLLGQLHVDGERVVGDAQHDSLMQGFREIARVPGAASSRRADRRPDVRPRVPERADRRRGLRRVGGGAADVGYLTAAVGLGGLVGAVAGTSLRHQLSRAFALSLVFWGLPIIVLAVAGHLAVAMLLLAVVGAANSIEDVSGFTLLQRVMPNHVLARVLGVVWGLAMGAVALGSAVAAIAVELLGASATFVLAGLVLPTLALVGYRRLRSIEASVPPRGAAGRRRTGADLRAALPRREGADRCGARGGDRGARASRDPRGRRRRPLLHRARRGAHGSGRRRGAAAAGGRLLRRDRARARHSADGDGHRDHHRAPVRAAARRLPRGGDRA